MRDAAAALLKLKDGVATGTKRLARQLTDAAQSFAAPDRKRAELERRGMDALFARVVGLKHSGGSVRPVAADHTLSEADETQQVEFKQTLHRWSADAAADGGSGARQQRHGQQQQQRSSHEQSHANVERVRRVVAAFANTHGGLLLVGVSDVGGLVGVADDEATAREVLPRTTGFIPAMAAGAVSVAKLAIAAAGAVPGAAPAAARPAEWWKAATSAAATSAAAETTTRGGTRKCVHVVTVHRSAAPFHSTPGMAAPPVRGQASTLPLAVGCMVERVAAELVLRAAAAAAAAEPMAGQRRERDRQ